MPVRVSSYFLEAAKEVSADFNVVHTIRATALARLSSVAILGVEENYSILFYLGCLEYTVDGLCTL